MNTGRENNRASENWDAYWKGTGETGAYADGGAQHPAVKAFWATLFQDYANTEDVITMLDLASGNGALVEDALSHIGAALLDVTCVDNSAAAIANIEQRFDGVRGIVADVRKAPLDPESYHLVTSQFGVEYAGTEAIAGAGRMVRQGGKLALLLHNRAGIIFLESNASQEAVSRLLESNFVTLTRQMFEAGFAAIAGADRAPYEDAARRLAPAVSTLEEILGTFGPRVADGTLAQLHGDVARMHQNIQRYAPAEVLNWLDRMQVELEAYAGRMAAMCTSAIDDSAFVKVCTEIQQQGFRLLQASPLAAEGLELPLAWVIVAERANPEELANAEKSQLRDEQLDQWISDQVGRAVDALSQTGAIANAVIEAKPAWVMPRQFVIGKIREHGRSGGFTWFVSGDCPVSFADWGVADSPQKAARHFSLQWQLDAEHQGDGSDALISKATELYRMSDDPALWL